MDCCPTHLHIKLQTVNMHMGLRLVVLSAHEQLRHLTIVDHGSYTGTSCCRRLSSSSFTSSGHLLGHLQNSVLTLYCQIKRRGCTRSCWIRQPCGSTQPNTTCRYADAGGGAPAGRSSGDHNYHLGSPMTACDQVSQALDTTGSPAAVKTSVVLTLLAAIKKGLETLDGLRLQNGT